MTKILLVEDDKSLREIYGVRLLAEGYDIVSAGDGEEALAMAIKERPQLIVSDVMMPKISGFDMLDILRSTSETKEIKVIMMTALSSEDQRARGESLGADRYLVKSQVGIEDVVRTVHDVLGDSLAPAPTAAQTFGTPAPSAVARPTAIPVPTRTETPAPFTPAPAPEAPAQPAQMPTPQPVSQPVAPTPFQMPTPTILEQPAPAPAPEAPAQPAQMPTPQPVINMPQPAPAGQDYLAPQVPAGFNNTQTSPLPQPSAPFGSPRPASLGDRVIHPLSDNAPAVDVGNLINQELNAATNPAPAPQPPVNPGDYQMPPAPQQ